MKKIAWYMKIKYGFDIVAAVAMTNGLFILSLLTWLLFILIFLVVLGGFKWLLT